MPILLRVLTIFILFLRGAARATDSAYDLLIRDARIVDGTGSPWLRSDVLIGNSFLRFVHMQRSGDTMVLTRGNGF